jgi:hypothetical protein
MTFISVKIFKSSRQEWYGHLLVCYILGHLSIESGEIT